MTQVIFVDMARYKAQNGKMCFLCFMYFMCWQDLMLFFKRHDRAMLQLPDNH